MKSIKHIAAMALTILLAGCQSSSIKTSDPNMPSNAFLDGKGATVGVVLCHGRGKYPTWSVVDPLRKGIHEQLGYHTLSIQMPTGNVSWREYEAFFPDSERRIAAAVRYLKDEKGATKVYLMGHSMGSRMATSYLANNPNSGVTGFIGVGVRNGGDSPLDSDSNLRSVNLPVVDVYGDGGDGKDYDYAMNRSDMVSSRYKQVLIKDADHTFSGHEAEMVNAVVSWLKEQQ